MKTSIFFTLKYFLVVSRKKKLSTKNNSHPQETFQGLTNYTFDLLHEIESIPDKKGFQVSIFMYMFLFLAFSFKSHAFFYRKHLLN